MSSLDPVCADARRWWSAHRDGEAPERASARAHMGACAGCRDWASGIDHVRAALVEEARLRPTGAADLTTTALAAWDATAARGEAARARTRHQVARGLLGTAGVLGIILAMLSLSGRLPVAGHFGQDLAGLELALACGFLLAAVSPARYGAGLLPVVTTAVLLVALPSLVHALSGELAHAAAEVEHLPLLVGFAGLLVAPLGLRSRRPAVPAGAGAR